ncbi:MAG: hypothetical protein RLZZ165_1035 [Bacteroidota bacterium]|jgi:ligand-binding SRPBCC domain-containing protein
MRFQTVTRVKGNFQKVFAEFDHSLLLKLTPPGFRVQLLRADPPAMEGGRIVLQVTILGILRQHWENAFSAHETGDEECHFVDEGVTLPFPLKRWRHDHRVLRDGENARIVDDVTYSSGLRLLDWLLYPIMWMQFAYRMPIYRKHFGKP